MKRRHTQQYHPGGYQKHRHHMEPSRIVDRTVPVRHLKLLKESTGHKERPERIKQQRAEHVGHENNTQAQHQAAHPADYLYHTHQSRHALSLAGYEHPENRHRRRHHKRKTAEEHYPPRKMIVA